MQTFVLDGRMVFEANDLEDALFKLANHFLKIAEGEDSDLLLPGSDVSIHPEVSHEGQRANRTTPKTAPRS